jgi:hypothetical protein
MLFEEEKLAEKGIKPTKTTLTEDFFLEMLRAITAMKKDATAAVVYNRYGEEGIYDKLVQKFKDGNIPNITDFRYLTKIIKLPKISAAKKERILTRVLTESSYIIADAYDIHARTFIESKNLGKQLDKIEIIIDGIEIETLERGEGIVFLTSLQNFKKTLESKIAELEEKLRKK